MVCSKLFNSQNIPILQVRERSVTYPRWVGKLDVAAVSPGSVGDALAMPSYFHCTLPADPYITAGLMMQFHEVHKQLCCGSGIEAPRRALGRATPGLVVTSGRVMVSLWVWLLSSSSLLFSERSLVAHHLAARRLLGAREHPRKALPVLMLTALKNPMKAGFFKASYKMGQVPREENGEEWGRVAKLLLTKRVTELEPGRMFGPCGKKDCIATGNW